MNVYRNKLARIESESFLLPDSMPLSLLDSQPTPQSQSSNWSESSENATMVLRMKAQSKLQNISKLRDTFVDLDKTFPDSLLVALNPNVSLVFLKKICTCDIDRIQTQLCKGKLKIWRKLSKFWLI